MTSTTNFYQVRHTAGSFLARAGVHTKEQQKIMEHSDIAMTFRYAHLAPSHLKQAMDLLGEEMLRITT